MAANETHLLILFVRNSVRTQLIFIEKETVTRWVANPLRNQQVKIERQFYYSTAVFSLRESKPNISVVEGFRENST